MVESWRVREAAIIRELAERYRSRGYTVSTDAVLEDTAMRVDLVARRPDETVLVEVRPSSREGDAVKLGALAEYAERRGWRFSIVIANADASVLEVDVPSRQQALQLIAEAQAVPQSSWIAAVAVVAAFEAAARFRLARLERRTLPRPSPLAHVQALAAAGLLTPAEESTLRTLISVRNPAAHGLPTATLPESVIGDALRIATGLVEDESAAA